MRLSTSSVMRRTVQRAAPSGGVLQTIAMIRCFSDGLRTWAAPGRGRSKSAASTPPCRYRAAILWTPAGVRRTSLATCGALRPWSSCNNAITRVVTRTCCSPFFSMLSTRSRSEARNRNGRGGRPIPWDAPPRSCVTYFIYSSRGRRPSPTFSTHARCVPSVRIYHHDSRHGCGHDTGQRTGVCEHANNNGMDAYHRIDYRGDRWKHPGAAPIASRHHWCL